MLTTTSPRLAAWLAAFCLLAPAAAAQQAPRPAQEQKIGHFVFDVHGSTTGFKQTGGLATAAGVDLANLPGRGLGFDVAAHVYPVSVSRFTLGVGGYIHVSRSHAGPSVVLGVKTGSDVTAHLTVYSPQVSINFGHASGWSYLSVGAGPTALTYAVDGTTVDGSNHLRTAINYGAGARWFKTDHLAFSFDLRFYRIRPQGLPFVNLVVVSAGVSVK